MATGRIGTTPVLQVRWSKAPTNGTTSLSGLDDNSVSLVYSVGYEAVYRNGVLLSRGNDYTATNGTTVTLIDATITGDIIEIFANQTVPLSDTFSQTVADGRFIKNTLTTTTGDIIYASGANTPARLGIGSSAQVLTVSGGIPAWTTPAGGGKVLQVVSAVSTTSTTISTSTYTDANISATITPSSATSKILVLVSTKMFISGNNAVAAKWQLLRGATSIFNRAADGAGVWYASSSVNTVEFITNPSIVFLDSPSTTSATTYKIQAGLGFAGSDVIFQRNSDPSSITLLEIGA